MSYKSAPGLTPAPKKPFKILKSFNNIVDLSKDEKILLNQILNAHRLSVARTLAMGGLGVGTSELERQFKTTIDLFRLTV